MNIVGYFLFVCLFVKGIERKGGEVGWVYEVILSIGVMALNGWMNGHSFLSPLASDRNKYIYNPPIFPPHSVQSTPIYLSIDLLPPLATFQI